MTSSMSLSISTTSSKSVSPRSSKLSISPKSSISSTPSSISTSTSTSTSTTNDTRSIIDDVHIKLEDKSSRSVTSNGLAGNHRLSTRPNMEANAYRRRQLQANRHRRLKQSSELKQSKSSTSTTLSPRSSMPRLEMLSTTSIASSTPTSRPTLTSTSTSTLTSSTNGKRKNVETIETIDDDDDDNSSTSSSSNKTNKKKKSSNQEEKSTSINDGDDDENNDREEEQCDPELERKFTSALKYLHDAKVPIRLISKATDVINAKFNQTVKALNKTSMITLQKNDLVRWEKKVLSIKNGINIYSLRMFYGVVVNKRKSKVEIKLNPEYIGLYETFERNDNDTQEIVAVHAHYVRKCRRYQ